MFALVAGLTLSPLITSVQYKAGVMLALGVTLLFLLFDIYNQLHERLVVIEECVAQPEPKPFPDFRAAEEDVYSDIESSLIESDGIDLQFLTVAGLYSWPCFEDAIRRLDQRFGQRKTIVVTFCLVRPSHFDSWQLPDWKSRAEATLANIEAFKRRYSHRLENRQFILHVVQFDNIPHWHGVLIHSSVLYLGRTEWEFCDDAPPNILVGQVGYRRFHKNDRFGGEKRIERFKNWVARYKRRHDELDKRERV